uniref:Uncharacterized protein n=1 Tax=Timema poppense TaxID=170557 RepID=A0A7R9DP83_TIMPO|nr:unnamed protein product [Timema poppensis]
MTSLIAMTLNATGPLLCPCLECSISNLNLYFLLVSLFEIILLLPSTFSFYDVTQSAISSDSGSHLNNCDIRRVEDQHKDGTHVPRGFKTISVCRGRVLNPGPTDGEPVLVVLHIQDDRVRRHGKNQRTSSGLVVRGANRNLHWDMAGPSSSNIVH